MVGEERVGRRGERRKEGEEGRMRREGERRETYMGEQWHPLFQLKIHRSFLSQQLIVSKLVQAVCNVHTKVHN